MTTQTAVSAAQPMTIEEAQNVLREKRTTDGAVIANRASQVSRAKQAVNEKRLAQHNSIYSYAQELRSQNKINLDSTKSIADRGMQMIKKITRFPDPAKKPFYRQVSLEEIRHKYGIIKPDSLSFDDLPDGLRNDCDEIKDRVLSWAGTLSADSVTGVVLCGSYGVGKTTLAHIARSRLATMSLSLGQVPTELHYPETGEVERNYTVIEKARFYPAWEMMTLLSDKNFSIASLGFPRVRLVIIDDVGREGEIPFSRKEPAAQEAQRQALYYRLFTTVVENNRVNPKKIHLLLTTNMTTDELRHFFDDASWSRVREIFPKGSKMAFPSIRDYREVLEEEGAW